MAEALFYHLTETPVDHALPPLLERALERGWRVRIIAPDGARLEALDRHLWTYRQDSFLPHGRAGGPHDAMQPILLAHDPGDDAEGGAEVVMLLDGAEADPEKLQNAQRVCLLFDGADETLTEQARSAWRRWTAHGASCTYWAQEGGRWVKRA